MEHLDFSLFDDIVVSYFIYFLYIITTDIGLPFCTFSNLNSIFSSYLSTPIVRQTKQLTALCVQIVATRVVRIKNNPF